MPILVANALTANINRSVDAYIRQQLQVGQGISVFYQRASRLGTLPNQWVEVTMMQLSPQSEPVSSGSGKKAVLHQYLINNNCYELVDARVGGSLNLYSLDVLVDKVANLYQVDSAISIRDYNTVGNPIVGALIALQPPSIVSIPMPKESGVTQMNVSSTLHYISESTL